MYDLQDVLAASTESAAVMTDVIFKYGGNSLGNGVCKIVDDSLAIGAVIGYEKGVEDTVPLVFDAGLFYGYQIGHFKGILKGSILTIAATGILGASAWGINKFITWRRSKKMVLSISDRDVEATVTQKCVQCGKIAYGIDEINTYFGFDSAKTEQLTPYDSCMECRK